MTDLTPVINGIIALIAGVISVFFVPWLKSKTTEAQWTSMATAVQHAVMAAEQLFNTGQGQQKKQYVLDYLDSKGFTVDDAVLEGTVNSLFGKPISTSGEFAEVE